MRRAFAAFGFIALAGALVTSFTLVATTELRAFIGDRATFVIPASEGYGIADCLTGGEICGDIVAQAWCEAHGYGAVREYGEIRRETMGGFAEIGAIMSDGATPTQPRPLMIACSQ
ncbi:hypothetical protein [Saliniramus sp.]|uniref:hypothetical protein n=1 Tax=Saliniramus sp. TaxID=2986772 RepID=UPI002CDD857E|nr:hypothetical protein [Saliniramus sp.]HMB10144.1 hypothetical protein [Saliniramus sp.]